MIKLINPGLLPLSSCLLLAVMITGCGSKGPEPDQGRLVDSDGSPGVSSVSQVQNNDLFNRTHRGIDFNYEVDPEYFSITLLPADGPLPVTSKVQKRTFEQFKEDGEETSWYYPEEEIAVSIMPADDYLSVTIESVSDNDNAFVWPHISEESYYFPFGEGKRVPADDPVWKDDLAGQPGQPGQPGQEKQSGQEFSMLEQFSMPFWVSSAGEYAVLFILEDPFYTKMSFTQEPNLAFSLNNEYPAIDPDRTKQFRIYLTDNNPVDAAKLYRDYVKEKGQFVTLEEKAGNNPDIRKLYGAPFIYLAGEHLISPDDIKWQGFRTSLGTPVMDYLMSFASQRENGKEFKTVLDEIKSQNYVSVYQKNVVCSYISDILMLSDFYQPEVFTVSNPELAARLEPGYENLSDADRIQVNKYALSVNLPEVFSLASGWMEQDTVGIVRQLKESGILRAWIGLNSWEQAFAKPELVDTAAELGYLIGSYDSYHSIHEPGKEQWITAGFDDPSLYEQAAVTDKNGQKIRGFQGVGRKLNPTLSLPAVKDRMEGIMDNRLPFNSWFIDCDATGEIYDDYTPAHVTAKQEDLKARLERMAYIRDTYGLVIGSEGGNDFAASTIAFAHGIELQSFSWMDDDMKKNKDSEYYIGKYYNPNGGVAEHFSKRIPIKSRFQTFFTDPRYDVPLFKLVYNDSVITSYHWDWPSFKIQGQTRTRMMREVLYNVPPLYHLDAVEWNRYKDDMIRHTDVWSKFSQKAVMKEMTDFQYLEEDGSVQKTEYGNGIQAVANFSGKPYEFENQVIPPESVLMNIDGESSVYTPVVSPDNS